MVHPDKVPPQTQPIQSEKQTEGGVLFRKDKENIKTLLAAYTATANPFSSFCVLPVGVSFQTQEKNEQIILLLRRHPATNIPWIAAAIVLLFLPIIGLPIIDLGGFIALVDKISGGILPALITIWYLGVIGYTLLNFFFWYFNVNIVTNRRVLDFDFHFLLHHEFSEALLSKKQDVTATSSGIFSVIFDYGDVEVQTAAATKRIEFLQIPRPREVARIITKLAEGA